MLKRARAFSVLLYHCNHAAIVGFVVPVETQTRKLFAHKSVSSFVITEAESFNNLAHCQRVRQHKCARKRRERKRAACVVVYNMFSCWLKNNTNPWTAEFFFLCLCITLRSYRNNTSVRLHIQVYQYAPDEKDLKDFLFGSGFWVNVVFADGTT